MNLNSLLIGQDIDPENVIVMRHRPFETALNKALPWLAADKPDVFNAYQCGQGAKLEKAMTAMAGTGYVASFIGRDSGRALFVGLYQITGAAPITKRQYWKIPANAQLKSLGMKGFTDSRKTILWFDLKPVDFYKSWKGKLLVGWPPPDRSWWRRAHRNDMQVQAVLEESALDAEMPAWHDIDLSWEELKVLPKRWQASLEQWRGIYYIFDVTDDKGYVGSAYGKTNILGRWRNYSVGGHGGNHHLLKRDPMNFRFSILQRVSPDLDATDVINLEASWKKRLHTQSPHGLNAN